MIYGVLILVFMALAVWSMYKTRPVKLCGSCNGLRVHPAATNGDFRPCSICCPDEYEAYREGVRQEIKRAKND